MICIDRETAQTGDQHYRRRNGQQVSIEKIYHLLVPQIDLGSKNQPLLRSNSAATVPKTSAFEQHKNPPPSRQRPGSSSNPNIPLAIIFARSITLWLRHFTFSEKASNEIGCHSTLGSGELGGTALAGYFPWNDII